MRQRRAEDAQQARGLGRREIADGRARKEAGLVPSCNIGRKRDRVGEVADDGSHVEGGKVRRKPPRRVAQSAVGNVDRHVGAKLRQLSEQNLGLEARARAELDQDAAVRHALDNLGSMCLEDRGLRPRRVILRQPRDLLEQLAAAGIVEEAAGQALLRPRQSIDNGGSESILVCRREIRQLAGTGVQHHEISEARRRPMNCQRWWG